MAKSIDGESIFLSDAVPPPPRPIGNDGVAPTVLLGAAPGVGYPPNTGCSPISIRETPAQEDGNETVLCEDSPDCCVGWLLAITGPMKGKAYNISEGRNSVGRSPSNRIVLPTDDGISRSAQVYVIYDPEENVYILTPGDGSALARINGKRLDMATYLRHGDNITLSKKTVMRFIPACDDNFKWESTSD